MTRFQSVAASLALASLLATCPTISIAEETKLAVTEQNAVQKSLEKYMGQSVSLKLASGQEIGGLVAKVGPDAVQLTQLQGKEFFDALVPLQKIEAIIVRAKS